MARPTRPTPRDWIETAPLTDSVRALARRGELCRFGKGSVLIQEGAVGDTLYIVLEGRLRVFGSTMSSEREITYGTYGPGEYIGEMGLDGGPRSASVMALETTVCAMITRRTLEQHLRENSDFAFELLAKVIRRARAATLNARQLALNDVYGRLRGLLAELSTPHADGSRRVTERLTHLEMAHRLGCSREMVSRLMKDLERGGYVQTQDARIHVLKPLPQRW